MLEALNFVKGAVSTKDFVPALTHFRIQNGRVTGYNGKLSLSAPIALDVDCCPKAIPFVRAIEACEETAQLHLTPAGKLAIRSGVFRAHVETLLAEDFPEVLPEGLSVTVDGSLLAAMRQLYEFTAEDASRPWAGGVLLDGPSAFATNNVVLIQAWLGYRFPYRVNVPRYAVKEMLRIGEEPVSVQLNENSITFHYADDRWLRTQLNSAEWPPLDKLFDAMPEFNEVEEVVPGMFEALEKLSPFVDNMNRVYFHSGLVATTTDTDGASVELPGAPGDGCYNVKMLRMLEVANRVGLSQYPSNVPFYGPGLRGFIAGMRK